tara:strand:+ start:107 stop:388 length:282 start_codon:yes stop_codon:yes gene_type:complete
VTVLGDLDPGQRARVQHVRCEPRVRRRLLEMGLLPGTEIEVIRRAPMGDPIEVRLRGYSLSLRHAEAAGVEVSPRSESVRAGRPSTASPLPAE